MKEESRTKAIVDQRGELDSSI